MKIAASPSLDSVDPRFDGVRFVYFDLDHTLWDHDTAEQRALAIVAADHGLPSPRFETVYRAENLRVWREMEAGTLSREAARLLRFERTFLEIGVRAPTIDLLEGVSAAYLDHYVRENAPIRGAVEAVAALARRWPLGILSNGFAETQHRKLELLGLGAMFREVVLSDGAGAMKPDPAIFRVAAARAGCEPGELLLVGDNPLTDVDGAARCGWRTILYLPGGAASHAGAAATAPATAASEGDDGGATPRLMPPTAVIHDLAELPALFGC